MGPHCVYMVYLTGRGVRILQAHVYKLLSSLRYECTVHTLCLYGDTVRLIRCAASATHRTLSPPADQTGGVCVTYLDAPIYYMGRPCTIRPDDQIPHAVHMWRTPQGGGVSSYTRALPIRYVIRTPCVSYREGCLVTHAPSL